MFNATFNNISVVSFIHGGNWNTRRKPPTSLKSLTNFALSGVKHHTPKPTLVLHCQLVMVSSDRLGMFKRCLVHCLYYVLITLNFLHCIVMFYDVVQD